MNAFVSSIRFAGDLPLWLVVLLVIAAVFAVLALYLRESKSLGLPYRYLLPGLRATAVAMVLLILSGPVWHRRQVVGTLGRVVIAVDTSQSMSLGDSTDREVEIESENRLARATRILLGNQLQPGWLEQIAKTHLIDVIAFGDAAPVRIWSSSDGTELPNAFDWTADGDTTDLSSPITMTLSSLNLDSEEINSIEQEADSLRRSAMVLMSDGRDTAAAGSVGRSATAIARRLRKAGTRVNALGLGSMEEPPDVGLVDVSHPATVASEGKLAGQLVLKQFGGSNVPVSVRIESGGQIIWEQAVRIGESGRRTVPFEINVEPLVNSIRGQTPRGIKRSGEILQLTAIVESTGSDFSKDNNAIDFRVAASTRNRKLLIVDGSSRWEARYLKNLFTRDPVWDADWVLFGPGTDTPQLERGDAPGTFPNSIETMSQYDAIMLGDIDADQFNDLDRGRLLQFVAAGGGLIVIDGRFGLMRPMARGELSELMPVRFVNQGFVDQAPTVVPKNISPTIEGLEQPALGLIDQTSELQTFWQSLPAPKWGTHVELAEGAESWADLMHTDGKASPWLATRMYGAGRVFYFASDQTWRWRYKVADKFHARFWNQVVVAAIEPPYSASDQFVSLGTDKVEYERGEAIAVRARLKDMRGNPVPDATVDALVLLEEQVVATIPMTIDNPQRGTYTGLVSPLPPGKYSIRIRASGFDESALMASTPIWIAGRNNAELQRMSLDENSLRQITTAGGGEYVHESDADYMLELLKPLSSGTVIETDTVLWQSFGWFWIIIALLATEWWLRKRSGLV